MKSLALTCAICASFALGCKKERSERELPVANSWSAPDPMASNPSAGAARGGHAMDPHAGMNMGGGDPHAGMNMGGGDPHAGMNMGGGDPHAGMNMGGGDPHAGMNMGGGDPRMANLEPPDPNRPIDKSRFLRGTIVANKSTASKVAAGSILFISVKPYDPNTGEVLGAPLAVDRIDVKALPVRFELTEEHAMAAGTELAGPVLITARVDQDGEALSSQPGDVEGRVVATIPAKNLKLTLDKVLN